ncbi:MAG: ParB/RepB/Spo0J family partition protein [Candidatus Kerfeldbacteria bacterium]|nr:ParB/RepB/Spo0J family partition protein [Candidatus Kerfeldbacteria bacterium]
MSAKPLAAGLGKGLEALIPPSAAVGNRQSAVGNEEVRELPLKSIVANPLQPRREVEEGLAELVASIREHGILQPLIVQPRGGQYELIAGERRLRAARQLGLTRVPVVIRTVSKQQQLELALVENLQRKDLNPIEEALAYQRLTDEFSLTQEQVAAKVGKSRSHVANIVRLPSLPEPIVVSLAKGEITEGHAKVLLGLQTASEQVRLWKEIVRRKLPVRSLEKAVHSQRPRAERAGETDELADQLRDRYQTRVAITQRRGRGTIRFEYYSAEEFRALVRRLLGR